MVVSEAMTVRLKSVFVVHVLYGLHAPLAYVSIRKIQCTADFLVASGLVFVVFM